MDTTVNFRTKKSTRDRAKKIFDRMGLSTSAGINIFLEQVIEDEGIPFIPSTNAKKMRERMDKEVAWALKHQKGYASTKKMLDDILSGK